MAGLSDGRRRFLLRRRVVILLCSLLFCLWGAEARAQPTDEASSDRPLIVTKVDFVGNDFFSDAVLRSRVRTETNRRFLGIPGFTWWRWVYQFGDSGLLGERVGRALKASGEPPAVYDSSVVANDVERLRLFYQQEGFRTARVTSNVDTVEGGENVHVRFVIEPGAPTYVRRVAYEGVDHLTDDQKRRLVREALLRPASIDREAPLRFRARRQRYSEPHLLEERRRLLTFLRNEGYAAVARDSIRAVVYPYRPDSFDVTFRIRPGPRFRFGDVHVDVVGPEADAATQQDTLHLAAADTVAGRLTTSRRGERRLDPSLVVRALQFRPGAWYDQSKVLATKRRLEATGVFSFTDIAPVRPDTTRSLTEGVPLPHHIELRTRPRHQVRFETFALQRSGVFAGSDTELGTGVGLSYNNVNLFGRGEAFRIRASGSIAGDFEGRAFTSTQAELSTSLTYPYLVAPFGGLERRFGLFDARTQWSMSLLTARREALGLIIRGRAAARLRLEMQHTQTVTSLVDLVDLSLSNPDTLDTFSDVFPRGVLEVADPVQRAQILQDYTQPLANSALRYTLRSSTVDPFRRTQGYSYEASLEVGGNLPYVLDRLVFSPDTLEGSLPGVPLFRGRGDVNRLAYQQYVRAVADLRRYRPIGPGAVVAWRVIGGWAHPTGRAEVVPFDRRFYSGGATSVRGWRLRELGPGAARFTGEMGAEVSETNIVGGDVKLEAGVELRQVLLRRVLTADWIGVLFADAGNVWFGPRNPGFGQRDDGRPDGQFAFDRFYREIGVGSGLGVRIAWDYLIARLDVAYKVHDPANDDTPFFPQTLRQPVLHFGIGHTF